MLPDPHRTADDEMFTKYVRGQVGDPEMRAAGVSTGAAGGYLVPPEFRDVLTERLKAVSSVRAVADHVLTDSGASLQWPCTINSITVLPSGIKLSGAEAGKSPSSCRESSMAAMSSSALSPEGGRSMLALVTAADFDGAGEALA